VLEHVVESNSLIVGEGLETIVVARQDGIIGGRPAAKEVVALPALGKAQSGKKGGIYHHAPIFKGAESTGNTGTPLKTPPIAEEWLICGGFLGVLSFTASFFQPAGMMLHTKTVDPLWMTYI
jgi:hypothetical protein